MRNVLSNRALLGAAFVLVLTWAMVAGPSSADPSEPPPPDPGADLTEPITGDPSWPSPGDETGPIHPFDPPARDSSDVPINALTPEEQAYVEANRATDGWSDIHAGFSVASHQAAEHAAAEAAANALGLDGLGDVGTP
jgi:hypothetical protein